MAEAVQALDPVTPVGISAIRALKDDIEKRIDETEAAKCVPSDLVEALRDRRLFSMAIPKSLGGEESDVLDILQAIQEASYSDSAVGWLAMIYLTTASTAAMLPPEWAQKIYRADNRVPISAGATAPTGKGTVVDGGVSVTGRWQWGSGTHHADWICGGTLVKEGDDIRRFPTGEPMVHVMFFEKSQVKLHDNWDPSGLRGTGSVDFEVEEAFVPEGRWTVLGGSQRTIDAPLYRFPFFGLFAAAVASVPIGIARRAVDDFADLARKKIPAWQKKTINESSLTQMELGQAEAMVESAQRGLSHGVAEVWDKLCAGETASLEDKRQLRMLATSATLLCTQAVDKLYNAGGGTSVHSNCSMQRHFRDIHTATAHRMVGTGVLQLAGGIKLTDKAPGATQL